MQQKNVYYKLIYTAKFIKLQVIFFFLLIFSFTHYVSVAQQSLYERLDSVSRKEFIKNVDACLYYATRLPDSLFYYADAMQSMAKKLKYKEGEIISLGMIGYGNWRMSNHSTAIDYYQSAKYICDQMSSSVNKDILLIMVYDGLGCALCSSGFFKEGMQSFHNALSLSKKMRSNDNIMNEYLSIAEFNEKMNRNDSALYYLNKAVPIAKEIKAASVMPIIYRIYGNIYRNIGSEDAAFANWRKSVEMPDEDYMNSGEVFSSMGRLYLEKGNSDAAYFHISKSIELYKKAKNTDGINSSVNLMVKYYQKFLNEDSLFHYLGLSNSIKDSLFSSEKTMLLHAYTLNDQLHDQENSMVKTRLNNNIKLYTLGSALVALSIIAVILLRNNKQKQKAKIKIENAYSELKSTQAQLIQSEKMASLGELTAGIAHEIQNPLNFINNFSEVNVELIDELYDEVDKGNIREAIEISKDIKDNEQKINHHGKRADAIVKGMLQHSRSSSAVKEPTGINKLADEYLRLAYHGLRARDKSFNATLKTDYDAHIGNINIVPQDIGRVILNLITNAFYAVNEKKKAHQSLEGGHLYEPTITVSTSRSVSANGRQEVEIKVGDNGNGIPQKLAGKIFQPFFTTKPAGQGTGLGLSLAYDIIKAHGGELKVDTKEGEGSQFVIQLPVG